MTRRRVATAIVSVLLACDCTPSPTAPTSTPSPTAPASAPPAIQATAEPEASVERRPLGSLPLSALVPPSAGIAAAPDGAVTIELRPGTRHPRVVTIRWVREGEGVGLDEDAEEIQSGDAQLRYVVGDLGAVGSGGDEQRLTGELRVCGLVFRVDCHDQAEAPGSPYARFCLPLLTSVEVDASHEASARCGSP